ncbi:MAG: ABC transporter substrate-binding protein [Desulfobacteraceae bacterium]|nr:MAG: ABC transporter substrate-binding protein [Desulfobacteraceae bacterium]
MGQAPSTPGISKTVTVYTSLEESFANEIFQRFEKETGIKVHYVRLATGECTARMEAEKSNPQAGIWVGGVGLGHIDAKNKGLTTPYVSPNAASIPQQFKDKDHYWTGMYVGMLCFESNTKLLKKFNLTAPASWVELCDPKYKGHVQMANPGSSGTSYNALVTLVQIFGEDKAFEMLKKLDANINQYTKSGLAPGKNASMGETTIAIGYSHDAVRFINEGYPLTITFPSEGTGFEVASVSLIKGGPEKEVSAAKKLYDFMLSDTCAEIFAQGKLVPFHSKAKLAEGAIPVSQVKVINQDDEWGAKQKQRLIEKWNAVIGGETKTK